MVEVPRSKSTVQNEVRLADLEGKFKFLKKEHAKMLQGLHREIESLKEKNKNLQFQMVFKETNIDEEPLVSEKDDGNKEEISRMELNIQKLELELEEVKERNKSLEDLVKKLEEDLKNVQETQSNNSTIIQSPLPQRSTSPEFEENKENNRLLGYDDDLLSMPSPSETTTSTPTPPPEYIVKLQEAEAMIQRLQNENMTQKNEVWLLPIITITHL